MALIRRNNCGELAHWSGFSDLETTINRFLGDLGRDFGLSERSWSPAVDLRETDDAYIVHADIPGLKKDDITIEIVEDVVTIKGERKYEAERKDGDFHRVERKYGSFLRTIEIPGGFNGDAASAKFQDGVLELTLPKLEEQKPRTIKIQPS